MFRRALQQAARVPGHAAPQTNGHSRAGGRRPRVDVEPTNHPLAVDQRNGVSVEGIRRIVEANLHQHPAG